MNRKFWKNTAAACLAMLMVSGMIPLRPIAELAESIEITASAEDSKRGTCGENVYWVLDEDNTLTISGQGAMADYKFDDVKTPWYAWREQITGVVIGKGVTHIGETAFFKCSNLSEIMIPDSVQSIGQYAFHRCNSLQKVKIPDGVTTIEEGTFYNCKSLTEITIPDSVTSFGKDVFENCKALTSIVIPEGVTTIPNSFLAGCSSLPSISIPDGVTSIGDYAFAGCELVETLKIPENVTSIGRYAFASDFNLASVNIPDGVTSIEDGVFFKCQSLQHIKIPDGVTKIGAEAFYNCTQLTEITIPDGVISIGRSALSLCTGLTEITLPDSVISIDVCSFENCVNLRTLKLSKNLTSIAFGSIGGCNKLTEIIIPESVTTIEGYGFSRCSGLTEIKIPENVTSIGENAFDRCSGVTAFTIPKNVTSIDSCAFIDCTSLQKIRILNPDCEINDNASTIPKQTFICGYSGSTAKAYAEKYGRSFIELTRITEQPKDFLGDIGETAEFNVEATGENLTYRWQFLSNTGWKDSGMEGANTPQLRVPVTAARDGQQYRCIVVSNIMTIVSDPASIKVNAAAITSQPAMQTLPIGQTAKFTVAATGSNLTYQWQFKDGMTWKNSGMTGANTATLSVPVTAARDGQQYRCIVTSNGKTLTSDTASIKVKTVITTQPTNQTGKIDSTIKFTVAASGPNLKYQWQFLSTSGWKNSGMTGANTAALSVPVTTERDGQQYRCVITSANGTSATTNAVKLIAGVKITIQPKDYTGNVGTDAKFTVEALGRNFGYQWQFNDNGVWKDSGMTGAKTATLSVPITAARNGQKYRCVVKSANGTSEVSSVATLKVLSNNITGQPQNATGKVGETVKFTVTASNATYEWQFLSTSGWKNSGMTGAQTATISVPVIEARDGQKYHCVVKFADGWTKTSNEVSLKVQTAITTQPQNQSGKVGTTAKFTVAASGTNLTYQWQFLSTSGWQNSGMTGAKTSTISVPITDARNGQQYRCIVSSANGTNATSNAAKLIVK